MEVYTIGFTKKTAEEFFGALRRREIKRLIDVRLKNNSQLAGFAKQTDLAFFLKELCQTEYIHEPLLAPTEEILNDYKKKRNTWEDYEKRFLSLMADRKIEQKLNYELFKVPTVLLCSEGSSRYCHRRLILEYLQDKWGDLSIVHL
ncbi:MAG TPA: hypothetical protein DD719_06060 [Desulfotomaculum sp.]|nr:hypothetical protein [Desulfotomaculum sp.]